MLIIIAYICYFVIDEWNMRAGYSTYLTLGSMTNRVGKST